MNHNVPFIEEVVTQKVESINTGSQENEISSGNTRRRPTHSSLCKASY